MSFSSDAALQSNQLPLSIDFPEDQKEFLIRLTLAYKQIVDSMNTKEGGFYLLQEIASFKMFFPTTTPSNTSDSLVLRNVYRMEFDLVAMNGGVPIPIGVSVLPVPANQLIVGITTPTLLQGAATVAGPIYIALPNRFIDVAFDNTVPAAQTIIISNNYGAALSQAYFTFEYIKET